MQHTFRFIWLNFLLIFYRVLIGSAAQSACLMLMRFACAPFIVFQYICLYANNHDLRDEYFIFAFRIWCARLSNYSLASQMSYECG